MSEKPPNPLNSSQTVVKDESLSFTNASLKTSGSSLKKNKKSEVINPELEKVGNSPGNRFIKYSAIVGRGSFKTVYKSLDTQTGKMVAWCELNNQKFNKSVVLDYEKEGQILKSLSHENIISCYECFTDEQFGLVMIIELMTSGTLKNYVKGFKLHDISKYMVKNWTRQILRGLNYLHTRDPMIIHRDLKCDNVFISGSTNNVKIGDYGLASMKPQSFAKSVIGTPEFMAPEMYEGHYNEKVDIYAFGMCLLELVTAEYPYQECLNTAQIFKKVTAGDRPECMERVKNEELYQIISKCIQLDTTKRPSAKTMLESDFFLFNMFSLRLAGILSKPAKIISNIELQANEDYNKTISSNKNQKDVQISNETNCDSEQEKILRFELQFLDSHRKFNSPKSKSIQLNEDEAIEFEFNTALDVPSTIVDQMLDLGIINEDDVAEINHLLNFKLKKWRNGSLKVETESTQKDKSKEVDNSTKAKNKEVIEVKEISIAKAEEKHKEFKHESQNTKSISTNEMANQANSIQKQTQKPKKPSTVTYDSQPQDFLNQKYIRDSQKIGKLSDFNTKKQSSLRLHSSKNKLIKSNSQNYKKVVKTMQIHEFKTIYDFKKTSIKNEYLNPFHFLKPKPRYDSSIFNPINPSLLEASNFLPNILSFLNISNRTCTCLKTDEPNLTLDKELDKILDTFSSCSMGMNPTNTENPTKCTLTPLPKLQEIDFETPYTPTNRIYGYVWPEIDPCDILPFQSNLNLKYKNLKSRQTNANTNERESRSNPSMVISAENSSIASNSKHNSVNLEKLDEALHKTFQSKNRSFKSSKEDLIFSTSQKSSQSIKTSEMIDKSRNPDGQILTKSDTNSGFQATNGHNKNIEDSNLILNAQTSFKINVKSQSKNKSELSIIILPHDLSFNFDVEHSSNEERIESICDQLFNQNILNENSKPKLFNEIISALNNAKKNEEIKPLQKTESHSLENLKDEKPTAKSKFVVRKVD